jgi:hypothetical protein
VEWRRELVKHINRDQHIVQSDIYGQVKESFEAASDRVRVHTNSGNIQGTFSAHSGNIQCIHGAFHTAYECAAKLI